MPEDVDDTPEFEEEASGDAPDETGIDPKDIELVMAQTGRSRAVAVRALRDSGGDLINAIMAAGE
ncbi:hypothetical protein [Streptomyces termitum]|uniref:hypothetical protein n=1 Tax=Streptomyces termitum TaxID=67368 RepID=UPI0037A23C80